MDGELNKAVCSKLKQVWMTLRDPDLKKYSNFKNLFMVLRNNNKTAARLLFNGDVNACVRCDDPPERAVVLPCGHVGCEDCLKTFMDSKDGERRCPEQKCKNPKIPDDFRIESKVNVVEAVERHAQFRKKLNLFFLDTLQNHCFTEDERPPEKKIIEELLEFVTTKSIDGVKTKELSPFDEHGIDASPTIRSFLLQLCLQSDRKLSDDQIAAFMTYQLENQGQEGEEDMIELANLFMSCAEDLELKKKQGEDYAKTLAIQAFRLSEGEDLHLDNIDIGNTRTLELLSQLRFSIEQMAKSITSYYESEEDVFDQVIKEATKSLIVRSEPLKTFLVKEISLKHRTDIIGLMRADDTMKMFLPDELLVTEDAAADIFNIVGNSYLATKKAIKEGNGKQHIEENSKDANIFVDTILASLELGNEANEMEQLFPEKLMKKKDIVNVLDTLKEANQRNRDLKKLALMMKIKTSLQPSGGLMEIFKTIITNPKSASNLFLPSMPHDVQFEVLQEVGKEHTAAYGTYVKFFVCPNGHVYGIGDCTRPNQAGRCPDCGAAIGGNGYNALQGGNREYGANTDKTRVGYVDIRNLTEGLREMTLFEAELIGIMINIACLGASFNNLEEVATFCQKPPANLETNLLQRINFSIGKVAKLSGKSQDDILLLLGILINRLQENQTKHSLLDKKGRLGWEKSFVALLKNCLKNLPKQVANYKLLVKEDSEASSLQKLLSSEGASTLDRLLRVRFRVTGDSLGQWLETTGQAPKAPTLMEMLTNMEVLEELANLPSIMMLHEYLLDKYSGKVSLEIENETIQDYFSTRIDDNYIPRFMKMVDTLLDTWNKLKEKVFKFGGVMADELRKLPCYDSVANPMITPAAFLFPASKGSGLCSYALVMFLVQSHNLLVRSDLPTIDPYKATQGHLVTVNKAEMATLLLAHTTYSIPRRGVTKEEYDIEGMERKLVNRYVKGCPRLEGEIKKVKYLEDRSGSDHKQLSKIIGQENLNNNFQFQLESDLKQLPELVLILESVCTAKDFLLKIGGDKEAPLVDFMSKLRLYTGEVTNSKNGPLRNLQLCHVESLINFLLLLRSKIMIKNDQNPFEQVIPVEYREHLPVKSLTLIPDWLKSVDHTRMIPIIFNFIWTKCKAQPDGDNVGQPGWPLKETLEAMTEDELNLGNLPRDLKVKHTTDLFIHVNLHVFKSCDK